MPGAVGSLNSVSVLCDDNSLRFGRVVDVADSGLFIDFLCRDQHRVFVRFGRVFFPCPFSAYDLPGKAGRKVPVQVLLREGPTGAWMWLDGELISVRYQSCTAAVVHWKKSGSGGDVLCSDIVPLERLRRPLDTGKPIEPGMFAACSVAPLDKTFRSLPPAESAALLQRWKDSYGRAESRLRPVDLVDGQLGVVYIPRLCDANSRTFMSALVNLQSDLLHCLNSSRNPPEADCSMLPAELWMEVFSHLDTVTQTALRVVAPTWNDMVTSPLLTATLVITNREHVHGRFWMAAVVFKCMTVHTQHVVLAEVGRPFRMEDLLTVAGMIHYTAEHDPGLRLRCLHLHRLTLHLLINGVTDPLDWTECTVHRTSVIGGHSIAWNSDGRYSHLPDFVETLHNLPCEAIRMTNCSVDLVCSLSNREGDLLSVRSMLDARMPLGAGFGGALWDALEEVALVGPGAWDVPCMSRFVGAMGRLMMDDPEETEITVCKVLCAVQSDDPRPSSHYRGKQWCVGGLGDVQLEQLSRLTRVFLLQRFVETSVEPKS
ncbi:uncharacterized protein LOC129601510 isoform X2 [Paramacrobiotus metropolitanus]|uniref:uncharacterized protein LOC129601510 isoform X2 n=1 Tax=Paramacrobiotus metropolitanus TaxID=2943436 RepID=UPI00244613FD|nr:uncharacterized protein LOC129601510 isoform X2 [Paramacrobiotus metropolitanus]